MNRVYVIVSGGLIQNVLADEDDIDVVVVDYDVDGADLTTEANALPIPHKYTEAGPLEVEWAFVHRWAHLAEPAGTLQTICRGKFGEPS